MTKSLVLKLVVHRQQPLLCLLIYGFSYLFKLSSVEAQNPTVEISTGRLSGTVSRSRNGKEFYQFLGIPYSEPPVGILRFKVKSHFKLISNKQFKIIRRCLINEGIVLMFHKKYRHPSQHEDGEGSSWPIEWAQSAFKQTF